MNRLQRPQRQRQLAVQSIGIPQTVIRFQAAVQVNADNGQALLVDPAESAAQKIRQRSMKIKSEHAVDDHVVALRHRLKLGFA